MFAPKRGSSGRVSKASVGQKKQNLGQWVEIHSQEGEFL